MPQVIKCDYCDCTNPNSLVKCLKCNKWFCNRSLGQLGSHYFLHVSASKHYGCEIHPQNFITKVRSPRCKKCSDTNLLNLSLLKNNSTEVTCMVCKQKRLRSDRTISESDFEPCIVEKCINPIWVLNSSDESTEYNPLNPRQIKTLENLRMSNPDATVNDIPDQRELKQIPKIPLRFKGTEEYQYNFQQAIDEEYRYEEKKSQMNVFPLEISWSKVENRYFFYGVVDTRKLLSYTKLREGTILSISYRSTKSLFNSTASDKEYNDTSKWVLRGLVSSISRRKVTIRFPITESLVEYLQIKNHELYIDPEGQTLYNCYFWFMKYSTDFYIRILPNSTNYKYVTMALNRIFNVNSSCSRELQSYLLGQKTVNIRVSNDIPLYQLQKLGKLNEPQTIASLCAINSPLLLIQGPPGTGKTYTSVAIVERLLKAYQGYKIMVCAPSNAAVDHIANQLYRNGINILRVMARSLYDRAENLPNDICLHDRVRKALSNHYYSITASELSKLSKLTKEESKYLNAHLQLIRAKMTQEIRNNSLLKTKFIQQELRNVPPYTISAAELYVQYNHNIRFNNRYKAYIEKLIDQYENQFIKDYRVICCTCTTAGAYCFRNIEFRTVLIDEASQSTEPNTIIPLSHGCKKLILVGDDNQLSPVVLSYKAKQAGLDRSLFYRLHHIGNKPLLLSVQYRMHPFISMLPNDLFYDNKLIDYPLTNVNRYQFCWIQKDKPVLFWNTEGVERVAPKGTSYINELEAYRVIMCIQYLYNHGVSGSDIGVITPYAGQQDFILDLFEDGVEGVPLYELDKIIVGSVDALQGSEKRYIIFSCVRSNSNIGLGFTDVFNRVNVAITRSKEGLILIGKVTTLNKSLLWNNILYFYYQNGCLVTGNSLNQLQPTSLYIQYRGRFVKPNMYNEDDSDDEVTTEYMDLIHEKQIKTDEQ